jgi:hypothetical protein
MHFQVDIIPTIFDLLDESKKDTIFVEKSIFLNNIGGYVLKLQPYEKQIGIVNLPFKYRYSLKTNKEYVYNLEADPLENDSIISTLGINELREFREQVEGFYEI